MSPEERLAKVPFFAGLPPDNLALLGRGVRQRVYPPKTPIVFRGDPGGALFVILSGYVKIHGTTAAGEEVVFALLGEGEFFGEMSVIDEAPYSADVTAWEKTECLVLDSATLRSAINVAPPLAWALLRMLTQRLRNQNAVVESLARLDVKGRVADLLLRLAANHGEPTGSSTGAVRIALNLTHADIAAFVGATRESVSHTISSLRTSGYIKSDRETGRLVVVRPQELARLVAQR